MASPGLAYKVEDRSYLLPLYKRFCVNPCLRFLPASLNPNTITHLGHLVNLLGTASLVVFSSMYPGTWWPFAIAALGVHLYNWADNADGAHARRTGQTSALGEFLDHGLDMFNTIYISYMSAIGIGAPPMWWLALALILPAAAGATYWEQAETGVFRLGRLNQIESVFALSAVLLAAAIFGTAAYDDVAVGPLTARIAIMAFVTTQATVGILNGIWRVSRHGWAKVLPIVPLVLFCMTVALAAWVGAINLWAAVIVGGAGNVYFGLRMLAVRLAKERPRVEYWPLFVGLLVTGLIVWKLYGKPVGLETDIAYVALAAIVFGALALVNAREGVRHVTALDRAARVAVSSGVAGA